MKINIISHSDKFGGAAIAAYRLNKAINNNKKNIQSRMIVKIGLTDDISVDALPKIKSILYQGVNFLSQFTQKKQITKSTILHSSNLFGCKAIFDKIKNSDADVINLHWINGETLSIKQISMINKPIVMTLHDMWAFCGSEHLSIDSIYSNFRVGYNKINDKSDYISGINLNKLTWEKKKKYWVKPFTIVTPSRWLSQCASDSLLFNGWNIHTIPNALNTNDFKPTNKKIAKELLNLPHDKKLIGFGAMGGGRDFNKGFDLLEKALLKLSLNKNYLCVVFGQSTPRDVPDLGLPVKYIGHINDDIALTLFYNAIDVMVVPSRQEAFGQTASESQSCGTPVVAFDTTGLKDVVDHNKTGYLAKPFDYKDLANGINWVLFNNKKIDFRNNCRNRAVSLWSEDVVSEEYIKLYKNVI